MQYQYCRALGKSANCQVAPSLKVGAKYSHLAINMTLYLGEKWATDPAPQQKAQIPDEVQFATKPELMLQLLKRARVDEIPLGIVLGDSAFGDSLESRAGVRALQLHYILGVHLTTSVCRNGKNGTGVPMRIGQLLKTLPPKAFRRCHIRRGSRGALSARFAFLRVQIPRNPEGESLWLLLEWRDDEKETSRAHLSSLPPSTRRSRLIYLLRERYRTEQAYREMKNELGLDHYDGLKWRGFEHHVTVVLCCYAFLVAEREGAFPPQEPEGIGRTEPDWNPHRLVRSPERPQRHVPFSLPTLRRLIGRVARRWLLAPGGLPPAASAHRASSAQPADPTPFPSLGTGLGLWVTQSCQASPRR